MAETIFPGLLMATQIYLSNETLITVALVKFMRYALQCGMAHSRFAITSTERYRFKPEKILLMRNRYSPGRSFALATRKILQTLRARLVQSKNFATQVLTKTLSQFYNTDISTIEPVAFSIWNYVN
jgi:hypothetical protein